jgi:hypothetical protein
MYPYLEISHGYGRKRKTITVLGGIDTVSVFGPSGTSILPDSTGASECYDQVGSAGSVSFAGHSDLSLPILPGTPTPTPTGPGNGTGNPGGGNGNSGGSAGGNNGNGQTDGQDGNGNSNGNGTSGGGSQGNSGQGRSISPKSRNPVKAPGSTLKSLLAVMGV